MGGLGGFWWDLEGILGDLGVILGDLGGILTGFGGILEGGWGVLGDFGGILGGPWGRLPADKKWGGRLGGFPGALFGGSVGELWRGLVEAWEENTRKPSHGNWA